MKRIVGVLAMLALVQTAFGQAESGKVSARAMYFDAAEYQKLVDAEKKKKAAQKSPPATGGQAKKTTPAQPNGGATGAGAKVPTMEAGNAALGMRYSVLKVTGTDAVEVPHTTRFKNGDRIQLKIQANSAGYLYIITQGTSGEWKVQYPKGDAAPGSNRIQAFGEHVSQFSFTGAPGTEKLFVVLSRARERELERQAAPAAKPASPAAPTPRPPSSGTLMAQNFVVDDPRIQQFRTTTRDLVIEEVNNTSADKGERAVYIAASNAQGRVVADIKLIHE